MPDARVLARLRRFPPTDLPDADLLARFLDQRDEAAFEALVRRHGPMVRAVCRTTLHDPADADDAFQATFLVLVRKADAVRDRAALGGWLYRIALRVSRKLRAAGARRVPLPDDVPARGESPAFDVRLAVDEEIGRLPEKYRVAVQLCYVAGHTTADAAQRLGWAKGTVLTRLAWARKRLRTQLGRRGVGVAVGSVALLAGRPGTVGAGLVNATVKAAVAVAAGDVLTGRVFNLTEGVVRAMTLNKLKWAAGAVLVVVALTGAGVGRWTMNTVTADPRDKKRVAAVEPELPAAKAEPVAAGEAKPGPLAKADANDTGLPATKPREFVVTRPIGTWVREIVAEGGSVRLTLKIDEDRITVVSEQAGGPHRVTITAEADYAINKESILYGVITSVDVDGTLPDKDLLTYEHAGIGQPFAVRFRLEADSLILKDFRGFGVGFGSNNDVAAEAAIFCGRYVKADGKAPARPAPRRFRGPTGVNEAVPGPVPAAPYLPPPAPSSSSRLSGGPPTDGDVMQALPRPAGAVWDDVTIVKDRLASATTAPRFYPFIGPAGLNKSHWECKVYYNETVPNAAAKTPRVQVVYLDTQQLVLAK